MLSACGKIEIPVFTGTARRWAVFLCIGMLVSTPAMGWENCSHKRLTTNGIALLNGPVGAASNYYSEFGLYDSVVGAGDTDEDTPLLAVVNHFYDAKTLRPLHTSESADNNILQAVSLGSVAGVPFGSPNVPQTTALGRGEYWLVKAVSDYRVNKLAAYTDLGHALHLMAQDVTQPAHVHNDPHVPYFVWFSWTLPHGLDGSDLSPLEGQAEKDCNNANWAAFPGGASIPPVDTTQIFPELTLADVAARNSYGASTFIGSDPFDDTLFGTGSGTIDVGGFTAQVSLIPGDPARPASDCLGTKHYEIAPVNPGDPQAPHPNPLCYNPTIKYAGTAASHFSNDWWNINNLPAGDQNIWDPYPGMNQFYFHFYNQVYYGNSQQTLNAHLQLTQLPLAANYSAALLKFFAQTVDSIPPVIESRNVDVNGPLILPQGYSQDAVFVAVADAGSPTASGVGYLAVESINGGGNAVSLGNVLSLPSSGDYPNSITHTFNGLTDGVYQIHAVDGLGNHSYSTFTVTIGLPTLTVSSLQGTLPAYAQTSDNHISANLATAKAPAQSISVYDNGNTTPLFTASGASFSNKTLADNTWYWVLGCDLAQNCDQTVFGIFSSGSNPKNPPPPPPCPPGAHCKPAPPQPNPLCTPGITCPPFPPPSGVPPCLVASIDPAVSLNTCFPPGHPLPTLPFLWPGDPNSMTGPTGSVTSGQLMTYTVEFENVGEGTALGVYIKDVLDPALDDTTLNLRNMYSLVFSSDVPISTTTANFAWSYDPKTRTVTLLAGNAGPHAGGSFVLEARLKSSATPGTVISNQGFVYFPNALQQITPTNSVISAVPLPTRLASVGASGSVYLSTAGLAAQLSAANASVPAQPVQFQLLDFSSMAVTNSVGQALASTFISTAAGNYNLGLEYSGDGFYYLPTTANTSFTVVKRNIHLQAPYAMARPTDTVHIAVTMADDQGRPLLHQTDEPKTISLEAVSAGGTVVPLASSLLSGTTAEFAFSVPQPLQLSWTIRARFAGDARYAAAISTGVLSLIDDVAPIVVLTSPHDGAVYKNTSQIPVSYTVQDNADLTPLATAYLVALSGSQVQIVANGGSVPASSLISGSWTVIVSALDWAGNTSSATSGPFLVTSDVLPPRTSLSVGAPSFGSSPSYVSSQTAISLSAVDDKTTVGDGLGIGVAQTFYAIDGSSFSAYTASFVLRGEGAHRVSFYSVDLAGNSESPQMQNLVLDSTPPRTQLLVDNIPVSTATLVLISTDVLSFSSADAGSGVAQTLYSLDGSTTPAVAVSTFSLAVGTHSLVFQSVDNVGNMETAQGALLTVLQVDTTPPSVAVQPVAGSMLTTTTPTLTATYSDIGRGIDVASVRLSLDGLSVTASAVVTASSASFVPSTALSQATHTFAVQVADLAGNVSSATTTFLVDSVPPVTTLLVDGLAAGTTSLVIFSTNSVGFAANDAGTGVLQALYALDGSTIAAVYSSTFSLTVGTHTLTYHSVDLAGNIEPVRSAALSVLPPDSLPPRTSLVIGVPRSGTAPIYISTATPLGFTAIDDKSAVGDGVGLGVARTLYAVDAGSFTLYSGTFIISVEGLHTIHFYSVDGVGNTETVQVSSIAVDATPPASTVLVGSPTYTAADGTIYVATTTPVVFSAADSTLASSTAAGSGVNHVEVSIDSAPFAPYTAALTFAEGRHAILYRTVDNVGNVETAHSLALSADATPPLSALVIGQPQFQLSSATVLVSSQTPFGVQAVDPVVNGVASGVRQTFYALDGGTFAVFSASFTLAAPDGPRAISFYSQDNVLNSESAKIGTVVLDATPPEVALLSPGSCPGGICRVVKGKFPVLGTAHDLHFGSYVLDYAPGQNAASGFILISSGAAAVSSGALGTWDASALPGWQTLRLTATDLVANVSALTINVFVGDPGELMILGNHDVFDLPQGVATDAGGNIYVADANADRVAVFTATGTFMTAYGRSRGEHDDHVSTSTVRLNKPKGVAVDPAGNIYVADTNDDRVLKLSAAGQVLLAIGRRENADKDRDAELEFHSGKGPGEFNKPSGVALDASGNIYVADTNNNRVQVLNSTGAFRLAFSLPPLPKQRDDDKDDHDSSQPALGRPFGIAVDAAGKIYVADTAGSRALVFGATGQLLLNLPITGATKDGTILSGRPEGIAVSTDGYCLLVSDRKLDRVLKFDALGDQTLVFGAPGKFGDDKPAPGIVFRKPVGLALAPDGTLLVADRNNDRVERFGLPTGKPALLEPPSSGDDAGQVAKDVLDRDEGGSVARPDMAGVTIPPGALPEDLKVTVSTPSIAADESNRRHAADAAQLKTASPPVEYGPEGTKFASPVTLTLPYSQDLVALEGVDETDLTVRYWNRDKAQWENLETVVDPKTRTVKAKTTHFSLYQVFSGTASAAGLRPLAVGDPTFMFHDAYAFPNPVRGTSVVTIRIQPGLADSVEVRAYDVSGRKVYSSSNFSLNPGLDDGNGKGIQYTYDNVWDISGVGSGVYQYVITAKKSGNSDIHKAGRIGVVK